MKKIFSKFVELSPSKKAQFIIASLATIAFLAAAPTSAWFMHQRKAATVAKVNSPAKLTLKAGATEDIIQFQLSGINVGNGEAGYKDYVFSVEGEDKDDYYIQLAHTTNINFTYTIYQAHTDNVNGTVLYTKDDENRTEVKYRIEANPLPGSFVNASTESGKTVGNTAYKDPSYNNDTNNGATPDRRQTYAEPLYWQSDKAHPIEGKNEDFNEFDTEYVALYPEGNSRAFLNYYVLRVSWDENKVSNDKETDLIYLTVELAS